MVRDLKLHLDRTDTHLRTKPDYRRFWHKVVAWVASALLFVVGRNFNEFWTTLGDTIYAPKWHELDLGDTHDYTVICHELAHRYDDLEHGWRYRLSYIVSWSARAKWEYRGYGMALIAQWRKTGHIPQAKIEMYAELVSGPAYLWAGDYEEAKRIFEFIRDAIRSRRIDPYAFDPNDINYGKLLPTE